MKKLKINSYHSKKFHLMEFNPKKRPKSRPERITISVSRKFGIVTFGGPALDEMNMKNSFVKLYYDTMNLVLAWKIKKEISLEEMKLGWKKVRVQKTGLYYASIKSILETMNLKKDSYTKLEVKKYKDYSMLMPEDYYYVEIK